MKSSIETQVIVPNNTQHIVEQLIKEARNNNVFHSICTLFAMRERTRRQVTLSALKLTMLQEGFNYPVAELEHVLKFLASLGIGVLNYDVSGKLRGLKDIKFTLQSIGMAAVSKVNKLDKVIMVNKYTSIVPEIVVKPEIKQQVTTKKQEFYKAYLTVFIEGSPVKINLPGGISVKEIAVLLADME